MTATFRTGARLVAGVQPGTAALFHENTKLWEGVEEHKPRTTVSRQERDAVPTVSAAGAAGMAAAAGLAGTRGHEADGPAAGSADQAAPPGGAIPPEVRAVFRRRRSARGYAPRPVDGDLLAGLLREAYGVTGALELPGGVLPLRTAPSAGGLYPIGLYVAAWHVEGWQPGCYRYDPLVRTLSRRSAGPDTRRRWQAACGDPARSRNAAGVIALTAAFRRTTAKYGDRGYRYALLEAGHIAQNLLLLADGLGLSLQPQGAFYDDTVARLVGVDGVTTCPVYLLHVGVTQVREANRGSR